MSNKHSSSLKIQHTNIQNFVSWVLNTEETEFCGIFNIQLNEEVKVIIEMDSASRNQNNQNFFLFSVLLWLWFWNQTHHVSHQEKRASGSSMSLWRSVKASRETWHIDGNSSTNLKAERGASPSGCRLRPRGWPSSNPPPAPFLQGLIMKTASSDEWG